MIATFNTCISFQAIFHLKSCWASCSLPCLPAPHGLSHGTPHVSASALMYASARIKFLLQCCSVFERRVDKEARLIQACSCGCCIELLHSWPQMSLFLDESPAKVGEERWAVQALQPCACEGIWNLKRAVATVRDLLAPGWARSAENVAPQSPKTFASALHLAPVPRPTFFFST